jgi:hypothetical protein
MKVFLVHPNPTHAHTYIAGELNRRTPAISWYVAVASQEIPSEAFVFSYDKDLFHPHIQYIKDAGLWTPSAKESHLQAEKVLNDVLYELPEADIFGLIFYLLSRAEEYLPDTHDELGRFLPEKSLLFRKNLHREPIVESRLIPALLKCIQNAFPNFQSVSSKPSLIHTFDIDHAYAYHGKPLWRQLGASLKEWASGRSGSFFKRLKSLGTPRHDPFNSYNIITRLAQNGRRVICFWQPVSGLPPDNNIPLKSKAARQLINDLGNAAEVGLHPSTRHRKMPTAIMEEKTMLERVLGRLVTAARTHFLITTLPETYRVMEASGIHEDFSMGWATASGFRAGTCHPFLFFDRHENRIGTLLIYPSVCMDGVLHDQESLRGAAFLEAFQHYSEVTAMYGGVFVNHWHNHTIAPEGFWPDGNRLFRECLDILEQQF